MAIPKPITRVEQYLASIAGASDVTLPAYPITREEYYLASWAEKSGFEIAEVDGTPPLVLKDSIGEPFNGLVLYGKSTQVTTTGAQLLNLVDREPVTICGLTWQIKKQCISVNGTATDEGNVTDFYICGAIGVYADVDFPDGEITISADLPKDIVMYVVKEGGTTLTYIASNKKDGSFEHISGSKYRILLRAMKEGAIYDNVIKAMLNTGSTALPWEPYTGGKPSPSPDYPQEIVSAGDDGSIGIEVHGKNIFGGRYYYANYANSILIINGNKKGEEVKLPYAPKYESFGVCKVIKCKKGKTYVISVTNPNKNATIGMAEYENIKNASAYTKNVGFARMTTKTKQLYTAKSDGILVCGIAGSWTNGTTTLHECTESELLQVEEASEATDYEPYRTPQTITITSPTSLPGIPVSSDGNYTDDTGQQWICDEVDLERGVYVQRVYSIIVDGEDVTFSQAGQYCNMNLRKLPSAKIISGTSQRIEARSTFTSTSETWNFNPKMGFLYLTKENYAETINESCKEHSGEVMYALAAPIEIPLSAADIAAYRALTTYKGTTILESECYLKVKYSKLRK
nr:MAG TPA: hypothetical protein [Caudoviricetes sp.]